MFEDLYEKLTGLGRRIRAIWIADIAHQGQSGILNADALGNDRRSGIEFFSLLLMKQRIGGILHGISSS
jgi:hypothetical protein